MAVAESAPRADTRSVSVIRATVGPDFSWQWHRASRGSFDDSRASCSFTERLAKQQGTINKEARRLRIELIEGL